MPENNPFIGQNQKSSTSGGVLDIDKIIQQEKIHAHSNAEPIPDPAPEPLPIAPEPVSLLREEGPKTDILDSRPTVEQLPEVETAPETEDSVDDEPSKSFDERYDDTLDEEDEVPEGAPAMYHRQRRYPTLDDSQEPESGQEQESAALAQEPDTAEDIIINQPKNTPNQRNIILVAIAAVVIVALIFLIPKLIDNGTIYETDDTGTTAGSGNVVAGLSRDVTLKKVADGLKSDDPDKWEVTFTADTTDITLSVDCSAKSGGGTTPNLSCVSAGGGDVIDGTFMKPFTAGEGWEYVDGYYGYCYSFADKVSGRTVQSELFGSSGIQLFYMADNFRICSKKAGNPNDTPKGTPCLNEQAYCPAVRLRSIQ